MKKCKDCLENFVKKEQPNGYYLIYIGNNIIVGQKVLSQNGKNINSSDYDKYCFILLKYRVFQKKVTTLIMQFENRNHIETHTLCKRTV